MMNILIVKMMNILIVKMMNEDLYLIPTTLNYRLSNVLIKYIGIS